MTQRDRLMRFEDPKFDMAFDIAGKLPQLIFVFLFYNLTEMYNIFNRASRLLMLHVDRANDTTALNSGITDLKNLSTV